MTAPREKWTDDRLDNFKTNVEGGYGRLEKKVDDGFARVVTDIRELRDETSQRFDKVEGKMEGGFAELRGEISSLKKSLFNASVSVIVALIACCGTLVVVAIAVN
jgi:hypothetical protein